jgi:Double zinc ribbon
MLAAGPFSGWDMLIKLAIALAASYWAILWLSAVVWTYRDTKERDSDSLSQTVAVVLVLVFNLPGLILYMILRPHETLAEAYIRNLETEAILREVDDQQLCYACQKHIRRDFAFCPHCRTRLLEPCATCGQPMSLSWAVCAYCGHERTVGASASRRSAPPPPRTAPTPATPPAAAQPPAGPSTLLTVTPESGASPADAASSDI